VVEGIEEVGGVIGAGVEAEEAEEGVEVREEGGEVREEEEEEDKDKRYLIK